MRENFDFFFQKALDHEGRVYEDVPGDRGGPTKCGVTLGLENHWGLARTPEGLLRILNDGQHSNCPRTRGL